MKARQANVLLGCAAIGISHVVLFGAWIVPRFMMVAPRFKSDAEAEAIMPTLTRIAVQHAWLFPALLAAVWFLAAVAIAKRPDKVPAFAVCGVCVHGFIAWLACFCFCFAGFTTGGCLHHESSFDLIEFFHFGAGVFPVVLIALWLPVIAISRQWAMNKTEKDAEQSAAPLPPAPRTGPSEGAR